MASYKFEEEFNRIASECELGVLYPSFQFVQRVRAIITKVIFLKGYPVPSVQVIPGDTGLEVYWKDRQAMCSFYEADPYDEFHKPYYSFRCLDTRLYTKTGDLDNSNIIDELSDFLNQAEILHKKL